MYTVNIQGLTWVTTLHVNIHCSYVEQLRIGRSESLTDLIGVHRIASASGDGVTLRFALNTMSMLQWSPNYVWSPVQLPYV